MTTNPSPKIPLIDRELSWLAFNRRVLELATFEHIPLAERLRFLSIFSSNLDEYFMKRIGGLKRQIKAGVTHQNKFARSPQEEIAVIRAALEPDLQQAYTIFTDQILHELHKSNITLCVFSELSEQTRLEASEYFYRNIFPLLTPMAVDSGHPFPIISNLSTNLAVILQQPGSDDYLFSRVKTNHVTPRWIGFKTENHQIFISVEELIQAHLSELFKGFQIVASVPFRVTRNAGLEVVADDDADDLLELVEEELRQRRFSQVVRLQLGPNVHPWLKDFLLENLEISEEEIYDLPSAILDYAALSSICAQAPRELIFPAWTPTTDAELSEDASMFDHISSHDLLVHHPYESFSSSVERFLREAVDDSEVQSIKMTVYRVGDKSPIIPLLVRAAEWGKHVVCLVEVKARFDEERNIQWAYTLEEAGVHVVYGISELKTHAKTVVVVRKENTGLKVYAHIGTGNYHSGTANLYTDLGVFTARPEVTDELLDFFNYLTGRSLKDDYENILVAPVKMELQLLTYIEQEIGAAQAGRPAGIIAYLNNIEDPHIIEALYRASQAGVKVDLLVRGICCLKPGVPGISENITVRSILGRFLEHVRLIYFRNAAEKPEGGTFFITSADWMTRNLHRRVELAAPILSNKLKQRCWKILETMLDPHVRHWQMDSDGQYAYKEDAQYDAQENLMTHFKGRLDYGD